MTSYQQFLNTVIAKMITTEAWIFGVTYFSIYNTEISPNVESLLKVPLFTMPFKMMHVLMVPWAHDLRDCFSCNFIDLLMDYSSLAFGKGS